ncbi:MAG TPA: hypothetical protein VG960_11640 [Caulobacteraceae bacterium]|nr:hypothetical protein [Caulobacteraceae bacterium]
MTSDISKNIADAIRRLYKSNAAVQALFDWTAQRERDATSTTLDRISSQLGISRGEAVALARLLDQTGCGEFIVGRHGQKSRFRWAYSCVALGQIAAGEDVDLEPAQNPLPESEDDDLTDASAPVEQPKPHQGLTLAEAKSALAIALGVPVTNIEIIVKA